MEKLFKSKVAFIAFVIIFTSCLLIVFKDTTARVGWSLSMGGLTGFVFAQWYWIEKMKKIQHLIDARMASPEQSELLKRKENELFELANKQTMLLNMIGELQNENTRLNSVVEAHASNINLLTAEKVELQMALNRETAVPYNPTTTKGKGE